MGYLHHSTPYVQKQSRILMSATMSSQCCGNGDCRQTGMNNSCNGGGCYALVEIVFLSVLGAFSSAIDVLF